MSAHEMPAGPELDDLVAEVVFKWKRCRLEEREAGWYCPVCRCWYYRAAWESAAQILRHWCGHDKKTPAFSTQFDQAFRLAKQLGLALVPQSDDTGFRWLACDLQTVIYRGDEIVLAPKGWTAVSAETAPLALCRAALRSVRVADWAAH